MQMDLDVMQERAGRASQLLSAMSNEKRLMILCQLVEGERSVGELAERLGVRQSTISQHLALLKKDGFVESRRDAQSQIYSLAGVEAQAVLEALYGLYCTGRP
ncbi:MAG: metalloregulator ArsR/SmtB family transcription factor [Gammaproteobacteria bacterium]|jgi:CRISPR locus-related DNA-binding protein